MTLYQHAMSEFSMMPARFDFSLLSAGRSGPYFRFFSDSQIVSEGDAGTQYAKFRVSLTEPSDVPVSIHVDTSLINSTQWATEGVDYSGVHRTLTFQPGELTKNFRLPIVGDHVYEANEMIELSLSRPAGAELDPDANFRYRYVTIENDDVPAVPYLRFTSNSVTLREGDTGTQYAKFRVSLTEPSDGPVRVHVDTSLISSPQWATEGADYSVVHRTLTFQPGELTKNFRVPIAGDYVYEANEMIELSLSRPAGAELDPDANSHYRYVTIENDDGPAVPYLRFTSNSVTLREGDTGTQYAKFRVSLTEPSDGPVRVHVDTSLINSPQWATEGVDYSGVHRTFTFQPGELTKNFRVPIAGDHTYEANEMIELSLSRPAGAELDPDANSHYRYVTIENDDVHNISSALQHASLEIFT